MERVTGTRCSWNMRLAAALLLSVAALAPAPLALAKEGVVARLENPTVLRAPGGTRVSLIWTLRAGRQPFGASGVYVRLTGRAGTRTTALAAELAPGRYRARILIPRGGVRAIAIGLQGWSSGPAGTKRADMFFPIANDPTR
jgi:hypothetical protein